ncbi:hypothetical protein SteCoe_20248 [Stentor coeruleus]|uniref:At4g15545-like C-terminal domain-containing protein n=1 Tax=Stentor coeruleus TaxID=5963 RepID=A0A1R2BS94_9CILI|nr:hypothetical protein SteCoe_20248 [Stentor coeruleus]
MSSEKFRQEAFKQLIKAWEMKEQEIEESIENEAFKIESEISRLRKETVLNENKIIILEEENEKFGIQLFQMQNSITKLKTFKENLKKNLSLPDSYDGNHKKTLISSPSSHSSINGKNFFREARLKLGYEIFSLFLGYIKRLNDKTITKEKALGELKDIFGHENSDLFEDFACLLLRKNPDYDSEFY